MAATFSGMDPRVLALLAKLQAQATARGIQTTVLSAYRSRQDQQELWDNYQAELSGQPLPHPERGYVPVAARPGHSQHEQGQAFDLAAVDKSRQPELRALGQNIGLQTIANDPAHFQLASMQAVRPDASTAIGGGSLTDLGRKYAAYLIDLGYSPNAAAGIVGNAFQENSLRAVGRGGDQGLSTGMFQWHDDPAAGTHRGKDFEAWLAANHRDVNDWRSHLDYFNQDIRANYPDVYKRLTGVQNAGDAANIVMTGYEVPGAATARLDRRVAFANSLVGGPAVPGVAGGPAATPGGALDWTSLLGTEPPPELADLGSALTSGGGGRAAAAAVPSTLEMGPSNVLPPDLSYAPASSSPEELSARYVQNRPRRQLGKLGDLFTLANIGQPRNYDPNARIV